MSNIIIEKAIEKWQNDNICMNMDLCRRAVTANFWIPPEL